MLNSQAVATQLHAWAAQASTYSPDREIRLHQAEQRLQELTRQRDRLLDSYQVGALPLDVFRPRMEGVEPSRLAAEGTQMAASAEQVAVEVAQVRAQGAETVVERLRPCLINADFETRQEVLRLLVERIVVHGQRLEVHLALPVSGNFDLTSPDH